jgi:hypothetical protein
VSDVLILGSSLLVCLLPLACFLFYLATVQSRRYPTSLRGATDFAYLFAGLGGFWIVGGPVWLGLILSRLRVPYESETRTWWLLGAAYLALLAYIFFRGRHRRRFMNVIFNVDRPALQQALLTFSPAICMIEFNDRRRLAELTWVDGQTHPEDDIRLAATLRQIPMPPNPFAGWLYGASLGLFAIQLSWTVFVFALVFGII